VNSYEIFWHSGDHPTQLMFVVMSCEQGAGWQWWHAIVDFVERALFNWLCSTAFS